MANLITELGQLILFLGLLALATVFARVLFSLISHVLERHMNRTHARLAGKAFQYGFLIAVIGLGFYYILDLDFGSLIASLGIATIAVAFAAQQIVQNAMAGTLVSLLKPFEIDDHIEIGGTPATEWAQVKDIALMYTILRDKDGRLFSVPNAFFMSNKIINYTKSGLFVLNINLWLAAESLRGVDELQRLVREEASKDQRIMPKITWQEKSNMLEKLEKSMRQFFEKSLVSEEYLPRLFLVDVQGTRVKVNLRLWIKEVQQSDEIGSSVREAVRARFLAEGIQFADP